MRALFAILALLTVSFGFAADVSPARERLSFDSGWRFYRGDQQWIAAQLDYPNVKAWLLPSAAKLVGAIATRAGRPPGNLGNDLDWAKPGFDDSAWRVLDVPHDWGIEGPFKQELPGDTGKLPWAGAAWYRKHFTVPASDAGRLVSLEIDGAMSNSLIWLNGQFVGGWPYGYSSYSLDLTPYLKPGAENVLAIRLDNLPESSRWYPGGGIYRHVWLTKTSPVHVAHWGTAVTTPLVAADRAVVSVEAFLENETSAAVDAKLATEVVALDRDGHPTGDSLRAEPTTLRLVPGRVTSATQSIQVNQPKLWAPAHPDRYVAITTVAVGDRIVDRYESPFGIRTVAFSPDRGFLLNGEPLPLRGVCNHHDLGALGSAVNTRALERQLEILRDMGCNAIRTSHNPPAPELLELCDRLGFVVMDEAFDCWQLGKTRNDYHNYFADWHEADLRALVRRDRNHPSVVLWSIGNEVNEQWPDGGVDARRVASHLAGIVREEDRTRPLSAALNAPQSGYNGMQHVLDAVGYNYKVDEYARLRRTSPGIAVFGAETASTISSRGEYFFPVGDDKLDANSRVDFQVSSYDLSAPPWATTPEVEWAAADSAPGYAGEFVWTGFDYLGEPTPYNSDSTNVLNFSNASDRERMAKELEALGRIPVPSRSSYFGIIDLAGFPKDRYYLYQSRWRPDLPMAHLLPHWTWPGREGQVTPVHVYTSGDEAELFLNGRSLGRRTKTAGVYRLRWDDVKYEPGELRVVAYRHGAKWAEDVRHTAGPATHIFLSADRSVLRADGADLCFVTVRIWDAAANLVPRAHPRLTFTVTGPADIVATDNGDATSFESFQSKDRAAYNGLALVILRTRAGATGQINLRATMPGLPFSEVIVEAR